MRTLAELHDLTGRVAVVTGAASGIGAATAAMLAHQGAVVVGFDIVAEAGQQADGPGTRMAVDVAEPTAVTAAMQEVQRSLGNVEILVNAAGIPQRQATVDTTVGDWDHVNDVNLRGTFLMCQAAAPGMLASGRGAIVNVSSQLALSPPGGRPGYVASKAAVIGLTRTLAVEWASSGVRVNAVAPGVTRTPMIAESYEDLVRRDQLIRRIPIGRIGEAEEIAAAIAYLSCDAAAYVTGHVLVVDGGYSVP